MSDRDLVTRPDFIQNREMSPTSQKALGWLDRRFPHLAGRFMPTVAALQWFRGDDALRGVMSAEAQKGGQIRPITTDHIRKQNQVFLLHHSGIDGNNTTSTIDPLAKDKDPRLIAQGRDGEIFDMPEDNMYLSTVTHRCAGSGPCVPAALWNLQDGREGFHKVASDLQRLKFAENSGNPNHERTLENPLEGAKIPTLQNYLSSLGHSHIEQGQGFTTTLPPQAANTFEELVGADWFERSLQRQWSTRDHLSFDDLMIQEPNAIAVVKKRRDWSKPMTFEEAFAHHSNNRTMHAVQIRNGKPVEASRSKVGELQNARLTDYFVKTHEGAAYQGMPRPPDSLLDDMEAVQGSAENYVNESRPMNTSSFGRAYDPDLDRWMDDAVGR